MEVELNRHCDAHHFGSGFGSTAKYFAPVSTSIILAVYALDLRPLDLGAMTPERARILDGKPVTVSFVVAKAHYTLLGRTIAPRTDSGGEAALPKNRSTGSRA